MSEFDLSLSLKKAVEIEPDLVYEGLHSPFYRKRLSEKEQHRDFEESRNLLLQATDQFDRACQWLSMQKRTKNINKKALSSYGLKHCVEGWSRDRSVLNPYVANGVLIAAAIHLGFQYEQLDELNPNVYLNISKRLIERPLRLS